MPAIIVVAEAGLRRILMPERMSNAKGAIESTTRLYLVHGQLEHRPMAAKPHLDALAVVQRDWSDRIRRRARAIIDPQTVVWLQRNLEGLDGQPLAAVNPLFNTLRRAAPVTWDGEDLQAGILVLRGLTTEFQRPLRRALTDLYSAEPASLLSIFEQINRRLSIKPIELASGEFRSRLDRSPAAWAAAYVSFLDRCRGLPYLCQLLSKSPSKESAAGRARRIAESFLAWDRAICGGETSDWFST